MKSRRTQYWRPNGRRRPATYLATIEAVYFMARDYHEVVLEKDYDGEYDDVMFFFDYFLRLIKGRRFVVEDDAGPEASVE